MEPNFSWTAAEYEYRERSSDWYWWVGTLGVIGSAAAIWFQNYLLGGLLLLGTLLTIAYARREPREHEIIITADGVMVDDKVYDMASIDSFWIAAPIGNRQYARLTIHQKYSPSALHTYLIDPEINTDELRNFFLQFAAEKPVTESNAMVQLEDMFI